MLKKITFATIILTGVLPALGSATPISEQEIQKHVETVQESTQGDPSEPDEPPLPEQLAHVEIERQEALENFHDVIIDNKSDANYFMVFRAIHCTHEFGIKTDAGERNFTNVCGTAIVKSDTEHTYHASYNHPEDHRRMWVDYWPVDKTDNAKNVMFITRRGHVNWCGSYQGIWEGFICSSALMIEED